MNEKHIWFKNIENLRLEVVWWNKEERKKENNWNVYVYFYPKHKLFETIKSDSLFDYENFLPFHGGITYHEWSYDENGSVLSKKLGCDYNHIEDDRYLTYKTKEEACSIFRDAEEILSFISNLCYQNE